MMKFCWSLSNWNVGVFVCLGGLKPLKQHGEKKNANAGDQNRNPEANVHWYFVIRITALGKLAIRDQFPAEPKQAKALNENQPREEQQLAEVTAKF
jgi:hypothetical protein